MSIEIIKLSSYTANFPQRKCKVKVVLKTKTTATGTAIKTQVFEDAIYDGGFVTLPNGDSYLAFNFLFHKLKRTNL